MKLSQAAVDQLLHIIADYDRERGIPHNYRELERIFLAAEFCEEADHCLHIDSEKEGK